MVATSPATPASSRSPRRTFNPHRQQHREDWSSLEGGRPRKGGLLNTRYLPFFAPSCSPPPGPWNSSSPPRSSRPARGGSNPPPSQGPRRSTAPVDAPDGARGDRLPPDVGAFIGAPL